MLFRTHRLGQYWQNICRCVQQIQQQQNAGSNGFSNNLHNNPFLPGFSSSPGWLLVTRTRGAWCRNRGHWRSGPRHLSPRSRVCAQEWHRKDIHSHIHSHQPMRTPKKKEREREKKKKEEKKKEKKRKRAKSLKKKKKSKILKKKKKKRRAKSSTH